MYKTPSKTKSPLNDMKTSYTSIQLQGLANSLSGDNPSGEKGGEKKFTYIENAEMTTSVVLENKSGVSPGKFFITKKNRNTQTS